MHRGFRKPLIIFSPKKLLRLRAAMSTVEEMKQGTRMLRYIPEKGEPKMMSPEKIERLVLCSGEVYYDLVEKRQKIGAFNVAVARVEQLSPFPFELVIDDIGRYPNIKDIVWCQEEPMNQGPWAYISKRVMSSLRQLKFPNGIHTPLFVGRDVSASTATGSGKVHADELQRLLTDAFDLKRDCNSGAEKYMGGK
eukprot:Trichotokara_eunicae@DN3691_c0_g1_i1.p1